MLTGCRMVGARACGEAAPDGYTFCILPAEAVVINPVISPIAGFDPAKSLSPVTKAFYLTQVFAVIEPLSCPPKTTAVTGSSLSMLLAKLTVAFTLVKAICS